VLKSSWENALYNSGSGFYGTPLDFLLEELEATIDRMASGSLGIEEVTDQPC
jgi:hypothetical protein